MTTTSTRMPDLTRSDTTRLRRPAPRRTTQMLSDLDREWEFIRRRCRTLHLVRNWSGDGGFTALTSTVRSLDELVAATQPEAAPIGSGDLVLGRLVKLAATDRLAGRVVLQRLLPGLISQSRKWSTRVHSGDPSDIAIGAAWIAIRRFDVEQRPRHVAPALIADSLWIGFRRESRRKAETEVPMPARALSIQAEPARTIDPMTALAATIRAAADAGVPAADLEVIRCIAAAGGPTRAAQECQVTVRTIRNRRDAAARRIRRALGPGWADWTDADLAA